MNTDLLIDAISDLMPFADIQKNVPLDKLASFGVGGCAELFFRPADPYELAAGLEQAKACGVPVTVLGKMTNVVIGDGGIKGMVISTEKLDRVQFLGCAVKAGAGAKLMAIARKATFDQNLEGLAFAGGIPGSVGGAVIMNAGAYGGEIKDIITSVTYVDPKPLSLVRERVTPADFGYRTSRFMEMGAIVVEAEFLLKKAENDEEKTRFQDFMARRREKQPVNLPSAGSVFKRPEGHFAGALIEQAGLKGEAVGGAQVSTLHAGFIVNTGGATAKDIKQLIKRVQDRVLEHSGVLLEPEVRIIGEE